MDYSSDILGSSLMDLLTGKPSGGIAPGALPQTGTLYMPDSLVYMSGKHDRFACSRTRNGQRPAVMNVYIQDQNRKFYFHDALNETIINKWGPRNRFERDNFSIGESIWVTTGFLGGADVETHYFVNRDTVDFIAWGDYIFSLANDDNIENFSRMLKLWECTGVALNPEPIDLLDYQSTPSEWLPDPAGRKDRRIVVLWRFNPYDGKGEYSYQGTAGLAWLPPGPNRVDYLKVAADRGELIDWGELDAKRKQPYVGYDSDMVLSYLMMVGRFRERVFSKLLGLTFTMLDVAHLTDLDAVKTYYQNLMSTWQADYYKIFSKERVYVSYPDRRKTYDNLYYPAGIFPSYDGDGNLLKDENGKAIMLSIEDQLRQQYEAVAWILLLNKNKLEARGEQLRTPNAVIKASVPLPWQVDPWQNPFILYDPKLRQWVDVAANVPRVSFTPEVQTAEVVEQYTVPLEFMAKAPEFAKSYMRTIPLPGGGYRAPGGKTTTLPALIALAAAGALFFLQSR